MTNAEKFQEVFGIYSEEFWSMPESQMLLWINSTWNSTENQTRDMDTYILVKNVPIPIDCGKCFVGDRSICSNGCPLVEIKNGIVCP